MLGVYKMAAIGLLVSALGGAWWYDHTSLNSRIEGLLEKNESLMVANTVLEENLKQAVDVNRKAIETIDKMRSDYEEMIENHEALMTEFQIIRSQKAELDARLGRHDLTSAALKDPLDVERRINLGTKKAFRCAELISGSSKTETENDAKDEREFNSECPWLFYQ